VRYAFQKVGPSPSFPEGDAFLRGQCDIDTAEIVIYSGAPFSQIPSKVAILIELHRECLGEHVDDHDPANTNVLGFARYHNGRDAASKLVELVRHANTSAEALNAARDLLIEAGLEVVVCNDQVGRILNRLVVPKYNAALRFLDEGLARQADIDLTCKLGLGYPDGPIERVVRGGLTNHYNLSKSLFEAYGTPAYAPPRQAIAAFEREARGTDRWRRGKAGDPGNQTRELDDPRSVLR
jgi:3-hydroxybutyryl-CoA dehydrogenase